MASKFAIAAGAMSDFGTMLAAGLLMLFGGSMVLMAAVLVQDWLVGRMNRERDNTDGTDAGAPPA